MLVQVCFQAHVAHPKTPSTSAEAESRSACGAENFNNDLTKSQPAQWIVEQPSKLLLRFGGLSLMRVPAHSNKMIGSYNFEFTNFVISATELRDEG
jgi:hypothetical protein